jgi:FkbM family methyltransferase
MTPGFDHNRVGALIAMLGADRLTRIVDVGANPVNPSPYKPLLDMGGCDVWGFEPQQDAFNTLVAAAGAHEHYLPHAIGDGETATLNLCHGSGFASLLTPNPKATEFLGKFKKAMVVTGTVEMSTQKLDDIADLPDFDLLKIDIQGGETKVFQNGLAKLGKGVAVITEVAAIPLYEEQPLLDAQMRSLRQSGYHLHKFQTFKRAKLHTREARSIAGGFMRSQLIDGDAIFVRDLLDLETVSDAFLQHLAILADAVMESYDLALLAIDTLNRRGRIDDTALNRYLDFFPVETKT